VNPSVEFLSPIFADRKIDEIDANERFRSQKNNSCRPRIPSQDRSAHRRLALLKRSGLFGGDTHGAVIQRASTLDELRQAYRLVHDEYVETGYIRPQPSGLRVRIFEALADMATFVAKVGDRVVGVLSLMGDSSGLHLPCESVFRTEVQSLRAAGASPSELTNQAVVKEFRKSAVATELMRCAMAHGLAQGYDEGVAVVSPGHVPCYQLMGFREIGPVRNYSSEIHDPVGALSINTRQFREPWRESSAIDEFIWNFMVKENPFIHRVKTWDVMARRRFLQKDLLSQLFVEEANLLERCSRAQYAMLRRQWGRRLFDEVRASEAQQVLSAAASSFDFSPSFYNAHRLGA
jgi:hypothetical protein